MTRKPFKQISQATYRKRYHKPTKRKIRDELERRVTDKAKDPEKAKEWFRKHVVVI